MIGLARSLNLTVTGEGIETKEQRDQLRAFGCDNGQGYYFARPMPADAIDASVNGERAAFRALPTTARAEPPAHGMARPEGDRDDMSS